MPSAAEGSSAEFISAPGEYKLTVDRAGTAGSARSFVSSSSSSCVSESSLSSLATMNDIANTPTNTFQSNHLNPSQYIGEQEGNITVLFVRLQSDGIQHPAQRRDIAASVLYRFQLQRNNNGALLVERASASNASPQPTQMWWSRSHRIISLSSLMGARSYHNLLVSDGLREG